MPIGNQFSFFSFVTVLFSFFGHWGLKPLQIEDFACLHPSMFLCFHRSWSRFLMSRTGLIFLWLYMIYFFYLFILKQCCHGELWPHLYQSTLWTWSSKERHRVALVIVIDRACPTEGCSSSHHGWLSPHPGSHNEPMKGAGGAFEGRRGGS